VISFEIRKIIRPLVLPLPPHTHPKRKRKTHSDPKLHAHPLVGRKCSECSESACQISVGYQTMGAPSYGQPFVGGSSKEGGVGADRGGLAVDLLLEDGRAVEGVHGDGEEEARRRHELGLHPGPFVTEPPTIPRGGGTGNVRTGMAEGGGFT